MCSQLDRKLLVSNAEAAAAAARAARPRGYLRGSLRRRGRPRRATHRGGAAGGLRRRRRARGRRLEVPVGAVLGRRRDRRVGALVVIPGAVRDELRAHAAEEAPNECCGVIVLRDGVADRYVRGRNTLASPYRYELEIDPAVWFLEDEGYELAVFHSHPETAPSPLAHRPRAVRPLGRPAVPDLRPRARRAARAGAWVARARTRSPSRRPTSLRRYETVKLPFMIVA